jgi:hypothetical protein
MRWINIKERLPKINSYPMLVSFAKFNHIFAFADWDGKFFLVEDKVLGHKKMRTEEISYWMKIKLPKENENPNRGRTR